MRLAPHLLCLRVLSLVIEGVGQIARGFKCLAMIRPKHAFLHLKHLTLHLLRLRVLRLAREERGQIALAFKRIRMPYSEDRLLDCQHRAQHLLRLHVLALTVVDHAHIIVGRGHVQMIVAVHLLNRTKKNNDSKK